MIGSFFPIFCEIFESESSTLCLHTDPFSSLRVLLSFFYYSLFQLYSSLDIQSLSALTYIYILSTHILSILEPEISGKSKSSA